MKVIEEKEKEIWDFLNSLISLEFGSLDIANLNWKSQNAKQFIAKAYKAALDQIRIGD